MTRRANPLVAAVLLAACSSAPTPTGPATSGAPTVPAGTTAGSVGPLTTGIDGSAAPSAGPSRGPLTPSSPLPSTTVSPSPSAASAGGWTQVLPSLAFPAVYLDLGFAGNGDVLAISTDDVTKNPGSVWIARYTPEGSLKARVKVARQTQTHFGSEMIDVDATDDTVLFEAIDFSTGRYSVYRVSSASGKLIERLDLHRAMTRVAVTPNGKLFGITATYGGPNNERACVVDRVGAGGGIATGVDYWLKACAVPGYSTGPAYFQDPMAIDVDTDGRLLLLDWGEAGFRRHDEPTGLGLTVITPGFDFVRHWHLPKAFQQDNFWRGIPAQGTFLSGDHAGRIYIDEEIRTDDQTRRLGYRLGVFDSSGKLLATYGMGGDVAGPVSPMVAIVDDADRLWIIDFDATAKSSTVRRLDDVPGG